MNMMLKLSKDISLISDNFLAMVTIAVQALKGL